MTRAWQAIPRGLLLSLLLTPIGAAADSGDTAATDGPARMVVLGIDGMDPTLLQRFMDEGVLPQFSKLAQQGSFMPLGTSTPPQSPVAWSNFITGADPGYHGIFDFLAFDRKRLVPYQSTSRLRPAERPPLAIGRWRLPLLDSQQPTLELARDGRAFWELLEEAGVETTLFRMPANYPPVEAGRSVSGMGTPDLRGSPGMFSFYTDDPDSRPGPVAGGTIYPVRPVQNVVRSQLEGPTNELMERRPSARAPFTVYVDPEHPVAEIELGEQRALLKVGEWSDWLRVDFELIPALARVSSMGRVAGMVRFYLKSLRPHFALYVSPINIDGRDPAQPISVPIEHVRHLFEAAGPFYTQEMPEDTKALSAHVLTPREFLAQSGLVLRERERLLRVHLEDFAQQEGPAFLFFYVSSVDQRSHMVWRHMDADHPLHESDTPEDLANAVRDVYIEIDAMLGEVRSTLPPGTALVVMSDHGFASFRRQAHLNAWLEQNGYLTLENPSRRSDVEYLQGIDWGKTRAFAIGLNSLYLNVRGREQQGSVPPEERAALAREIAAGLSDWIDPQTGQNIVSAPLLREEIYHGPHVEEAPDILVGYAPGYRSSWATASGEVPEGLLEDNDREWSGDHCMDARSVPGVLITNRMLRAKSGQLRDLTVSILAHFGLDAPAHMRGQPLF